MDEIFRIHFVFCIFTRYVFPIKTTNQTPLIFSLTHSVAISVRRFLNLFVVWLR